MRHRVIAGNAITVVGRYAIPVGIGAGDPRVVVDGAHHRVLLVVREPAAVRQTPKEIIGFFSTLRFIIPGQHLAAITIRPPRRDGKGMVFAFIPDHII